METLSSILFVGKVSIIIVSLFIYELILSVRSAIESIFSIFGVAGYHRPLTPNKYIKLVDKNNPSSRYDARQILRSTECAICLTIFKEGEKIRQLRYCNHTFHKDCVDTWLRQELGTCPSCRSEVLPKEIAKMHRERREDLRLPYPYYRILEDENDWDIDFMLTSYDPNSPPML